jgi:ankyrin repeat protein
MDPAKKLKALIKKLETKKKRIDPNAHKTRGEQVIAKINEVLVRTQVEYVERRVALSGVSAATVYARLGDDVKLRDEIQKPSFSINERDVVTGKNILMEAIAGGHYHVVRMLLYEFHAKPNVCSLLGSISPLHVAVEKGYRQIASILLTRGADVNALDSRGCTPMHYVSKISLARLLHRFPVDCCVRSREKLRPSEHYRKYCLVEEFDINLEQYLADKEAAHDIASLRKLTIAGEKKEREREREKERRDNDSDEEFEAPLRTSMPQSEVGDDRKISLRRVPNYKTWKKPSTSPGMQPGATGAGMIITSRRARSPR